MKREINDKEQNLKSCLLLDPATAIGETSSDIRTSPIYNKYISRTTAISTKVVLMLCFKNKHTYNQL